MQLTIERSALLKALGHVQSVVERRNTIPILSNVLLSAGRDKLAFAATDLDMEMVDEAEAVVQVEGQITAPAHTLYEIIRKLPEGAEVSLTYNSDDPRLTVSAGRSKFNLPVLPAGDFPVMSADTGGTRYAVAKEDLARLIDKTRFAVSTEETRYYLNGLYLHTVADVRAGDPAPDGSGPVEVQVSPQKIRFEFGQASLTSKVIDGAFPDYMRVIPKGNDKRADIDNATFKNAVDRVATISAEKSRSVKLAFELDRVTLTVRNMEAGQGVEEVEIGYSEEPFEIGFNARYLLDVAGQITGENATFMFADPASPTLVLDPGDPGVQYVLMPLRV